MIYLNHDRPAAPNDLIGLAGVVVLLGARHGFDPDHLATIDGLTRAGSARHPVASRACGLLFSLGHGLIVLVVAATVTNAATSSAPPQWLKPFGAWASIGFLTLLGVTNIAAVLQAPRYMHVAPMGLRYRLVRLALGRTSAQWAGHPLLALPISALFAMSFDTVAQAPMFSAATGRSGGWTEAVGCALLFTLGMVAVDGVNGLWIAKLLRRSDATALLTSRGMGLGVGAISLVIAGLGLARLASNSTERWLAGNEALCGVAFLAAIGVIFVMALSLSSANIRRLANAGLPESAQRRV